MIAFERRAVVAGAARKSRASRSHFVRRLPIALALVAFLLSFVSGRAAVTASAGDDVLYRILSSEELVAANGDILGREVLCACYTATDRITVIRTSGDAPISSALDQESDFDGAVWLFDVGNRGAPQVIVFFHRLDGLLTADLYQDQDGDGQVELERRGREVTVTESNFWSIRVVARDGFWQRDGRLAPNLDLTVDEQMYATFGGRLYFEAMKNDGQADVGVQVRGPSETDPRSYDWRNVHTPFPASSGIYRTTLMVREEGVEPDYPPMFPWYLLGATDGPTAPDGSAIANVLHEGFDDGIVKLPGRSHPPIQVDWSLGRAVYLGEFVASRGSDYNWFTYSIKRVEPQTLTNPNFESPFAFYDLAADRDAIPELAIRVGRFGDDAPAEQGSPNGSQGAQAIRYSWDQANDSHWNFKLGLLGRQTVDGRVNFPDFELQTIPYQDVPTWVTGQSWDVVTFVAAERPIFTSEGIYDWDFLRPTSDYYGGVGAQPLDLETAFSDLGGGLRGDYSFHYDQAPVLTFNPVDRKLHLERAEGGIWRLLAGGEIRYFNLTGGRAIDGWQRWDGGRLISQLYRVPGGLIYSDAEQTLYLRVDVPDELFHTPPPANHDEWLALGEQLNSHSRALPPGDLRAMFDQFGGTPVQIAAGPLSDFRLTEGGLRFVVRADDDVTRDVLGAIAGTRPAPGPQVVSLVDGQWTVEPGTYATVDFAMELDDVTVLRESPMVVTVVNDGAVDITNAELRVVAVAADGRRFTLLGAEPVEVAGHSSHGVNVVWSPRTAGAWTLEVSLYRAGANQWTAEPVVIAEATQPFEVEGVPQVTFGTAIQLGWPGVTLERVLVVLAVVALTGAIAGFGLTRPDQYR